MSGVTSSFRFPGQLNNSNLKEFATNLIPFPKLHFLTIGLAPLTIRGAQHYNSLTIPELIQSMFNTKNMMCKSDLIHGKALAAFTMFRGAMSTEEI